jgi:hypothetical protein
MATLVSLGVSYEAASAMTPERARALAEELHDLRSGPAED